MAATATVQTTVEIGGSKRLYYGTIAFDSSYPTGGEAIDVGSNERLDVVFCGTYPSATVGYLFSWDAANQKLRAHRTDQVDDPAEEVPDTTDLSALTSIPFLAIGS